MPGLRQHNELRDMLEADGFEVTLEHPGYVSIKLDLEDARFPLCYLNVGDANDEWGADLMNEDREAEYESFVLAPNNTPTSAIIVRIKEVIAEVNLPSFWAMRGFN